ncbi:MAG TPA: hypothetical protein DCR12_01580 [Lachnospiraceae bacterium]|nr:hypothetical protein [Lachnospiraceae bacterium]
MDKAIVFNDFCLCAQYDTEDDFCELFLRPLIGIMDIMYDNEISLLKSYYTYTDRVTEDMTLGEYLNKGGNPFISLFAQQVVMLTYNDPWWDEDPRTDVNAHYEYDDKSSEPNCITEAIERGLPLLSVGNNDEKGDKLLIQYLYKKNGEIGGLYNVTDVSSMYLISMIKFQKFIGDVIKCYPYEIKKSSIFEIDVDDSAKETFKKNNFSEEDLLKIVHRVNWMVSDKINGKKSHWFDELGNGLFEYRVSISEGREFRWYCVWKEKLVFLNACIKKSQKPDQRVINKAENLAKRY